MKPYPQYKDSGIEWIGDVPDGWKIVPIKRIVSTKITDGPHETPEILLDGIPFVSAESIRNDSIDFSKKRGFISTEDHERFSKKYKPLKGDIYIVKSGATTGKIAIVETDEEFNIWSPLAAIRCNCSKAFPRFAFYFFKSKEFLQSIEISWNFGTQQNIGMGVIENLPLSLPSLSEQTTIAAFLDRKTAEIDSIIAKKERLIELYEEEKVAVINHAVTKGLDPAAKMKDSGIEWLGEIPEHWEVKRICSLFLESSARASNEDETQYPVLSVSIHDGISDKELDENEMDRKVTRSEDKSLYKIVHYNYLAYNMMRAWQGGFGASRLSGLVSPAYVVCKPKTDIDSYFFELILRTPNAITEMKRFSKGIVDFRLRLYWDDFRNIVVPVPPVHEIKNILDYIETKCSHIDAIISKFKRQIELLKEYRTALISEAVTGKIDLRHEI